MKNIALLVTIALIPIVGFGGYALNKNDIPAFGDYLLIQENVKHVPGGDTDDWMAVAITGPNKGGAMDLLQALSFYGTQKDIEQGAGGKVGYYEVKCQNYTNDGKEASYTTPSVIRKCSSVKKTRKQAEKQMLILLQPEPKS